MKKLNDIVQFRGDRLFNGAVNIDWFLTDDKRRRDASEAFIFHGPAYHGVTQADVGSLHGHQLQDTASFVNAIVKRCAGLEEQPFTLAIAGYGTGKSHLALTLATLFRDPSDPEAEGILARLCSADATIGGEVRTLFQENNVPYLVVALNGMRSFDLVAEMTQQILAQVQMHHLDTRPLDDLRPRFSQAANLIRMSNAAVVEELVESSGAPSAESLLQALDEHDEEAYAGVHDFFASKGMPIRALGGESVKELIDAVAQEYCGPGKPFGRLVVLFDEFGRFTEFATVRSQVAGSGVLQDLFEGIQSNSDSAAFVGFIQFELNAYVQRVASEFRNDILRYVTRYQSASKAYLSVNLETLIAHLLQKNDPKRLDQWFDTKAQLTESSNLLHDINEWFPQSRSYRLWSTDEQFHTVIRKGCWPLSPMALWLLFYLTIAGKHLQERSVLALLAEVFEHYGNKKIPSDGEWLLHPVDLWSDALQEELLSSEETGQRGTITHSYAAVVARHGARLDAGHLRLLRAVVLCGKLGLCSESKEDAVEALAQCVGQPTGTVAEQVDQLDTEYNVIHWDESFKLFDILGDAVPRTQFLAFLRQQVASSFDENAKACLFSSKGQDWCELLKDLDCDYAESNQISTREWKYSAVTSTLEQLETQLKLALERWRKSALAVDVPRGTLIYCYVGQSKEAQSAEVYAQKQLRKIVREAKTAFPVLVVLLCDEEGLLGQAMAELTVLEDELTEEDKAKFGSLVGAHIEKLSDSIRTHVEAMIRARKYLTATNKKFEAARLVHFGSKLFAHIYKSPLAFPFDGFTTTRGNAADTCQQLTSELIAGKLDYESVMAKQKKSKNRAVAVLKDCWGIFNRSGAVLKKPNNRVLRSLSGNWDAQLQSQQNLSIGALLSELCSPPYGANLASAGLALGVFIAARAETLVVVRGGEQIALSQWVQDGAFKGKFIDVENAHQVELAQLGKASSEWENLIEEWEQAESHHARSMCLERAHDLQERIPVPPTLRSHVELLTEQAEESLKALVAFAQEEDDAHNQIKRGEERKNVRLLSSGGANLLRLLRTAEGEGPRWTQDEIESLQRGIERSRLLIAQNFQEWLERQAPKNDNPETVGDFKHRMNRVIGGNLQELGFQQEFEALSIRVAGLLKNVETAAEAQQLLRDVQSWIDQQGDPCRIVRIARLRDLHKVGREYQAKLQGMSRRIQLTEISERRSTLSEFLKELKSTQEEMVRRASTLHKAKLRPDKNIDELIQEVEQLITIFEGCDTDLEDLRLMQQALRFYEKTYNQLGDQRLTWKEFEALKKTLRKEAEKTVVDEGIPWDLTETFACMDEQLTKERKAKSLDWVQEREADAAAVGSMSAEEANQLHNKITAPPACITKEHAKRVDKVKQKVEARLNTLTVDWLLEKFKELPQKARKDFLKKIDTLEKA
ncbi:MAG: hypothetical protein ACOX5J_12435 [Candidatus Hydrogenedentales bacterium]|jgi:hypothetical protein